MNKYDGYYCKIFRPEAGNPDSLSNNDILALYEDADGALWIGTGYGLDRLDHTTGIFTHYRFRDEASNIFANRVTDILQSRSGTLWVGTINGLNKLDIKTGKITRFFNRADDAASISSNAVNVIHEDGSGVLWVGTLGGLNRMEPGATGFTAYFSESGNPDSISNNSVTAILEGHSGEFWIGTLAGLNLMDRETGKFTRYHSDPRIPHSLSSDNIAALFEDHNSLLWVGTANGGLNFFERRRERFVHFRRRADEPGSLGSDFITSIYEDASGILWVGTRDNGVSYFDRQRERFRRYIFEPGNPRGLSHQFVYCILEDRRGTLWVGTSGGGLNRMEADGQHYVHFRADAKNPLSLSSDLVYCLLEDRRGTLWVGTQNGGLNEFNRETETFETYLNRPGDPSSISSNGARRIFEDSQGQIWIGLFGTGLDKFDHETGTFKNYRNEANNPASLSNDFVLSISEGDEHTLWLGTVGGLNKFDKRSGTVTRFLKDINNPKSLSNDVIMCVHPESRGILWIGTQGGGLNRLDTSDGTVTHYREKDGLPNDVVYGILKDEEDFFWLSTNKGISKFDPALGTFQNYTPGDGLQSNEFNGGSYYKSPSGEMFFGGVKGFNSFYPAKVEDNETIPPVVITDFRIFNKPVPVGTESSLKKPISETEEIQLSHLQNSISLKFVALNYSISEKNQYRYILEGFEEEWSKTGSDKRYASYTNLEPGPYVFRVTGSNNDGVWNSEGVSLRIIIMPPFWQTLWFRLLAGALLGLIMSMLYRNRMKAVLRKTRLEAELQTAHDAQMSIMPQADPRIKGFGISGICVPAGEVGGDFFDYMWLNGEKNQFGIAIGDVSGKAMKAAMTAIMSSGMLYSKIDEASSVEEIMTGLNRPLYRKTDKAMFTALCLVSLDIVSGEFIYCNAGLSRPLLKSGDSVTFLKGEGPRFPLGSVDNNVYREAGCSLKSGDVVVLYTDGIPEADNRRGEFYGNQRLKELLENLNPESHTAAGIKEIIIADVKRFAGSMPQHDDMTVVVIKYSQ
ncbi:MAG: SpoIIE family protein phosphatase [bacterium]|nr:SpoIIE family protein phosphatase [bacterium]